MLYVGRKETRSYGLFNFGRTSRVCVGELMIIIIIQSVDDRCLTGYAEYTRCVTA